jgi:hypothetical protein
MFTDFQKLSEFRNQVRFYTEQYPLNFPSSKRKYGMQTLRPIQ